MKKLTALISALLLVLLCAAAFADTEVTASGTGTVLVPADTAVISLGVSARNPDVLQAQGRVNEAIAAIRRVLTDAGIPSEDISTDYINIFAIYDYRETGDQLSSYEASSTLAIRTEEINRVGEMVDLAFRAGANTLNGISFSARNTEEARKEALQAAVRDAMDKAETLAAAAGLRITGIEQIGEESTFHTDTGASRFEMKASGMAESADAATEVQAAKVSVVSTVSIRCSAEKAE